MPRVLATVDEGRKAWVESRADSLDVSEAEVIRRLIDAGRGDESLLESDLNHDSVDESPNESAVIRRIDALEERIAALEAGRDSPVDSDAAHSGAQPIEAAKDSDPSASASSGRGSPPEADAGVRERVESIAERIGWADDGRRAERIDAATAAVEFARERETASKSEVKSEIEPSNPVSGQSPDVWYRKTVKPAFKQLGEYDSGAKGYRINEI